MNYRERLLQRYSEYTSSKYYGVVAAREFFDSLNPIELEFFRMQEEIDKLKKELKECHDTITQLRERNSFIVGKMGGVALAVSACGIKG